MSTGPIAPMTPFKPATYIIQAEPASERAILQMRIKNQRKELRRLNRLILQYQAASVSNGYQQDAARSNAYRHAAVLAESHPWWFGKRIGRAIRKWL